MMAGPKLVNNNHTAEGSLPPPRFDGQATARAQPVEPIHFDAERVHKSMFARWLQWLPSLTGHIGSQSRALAVVVIIGLITGALGGVLLVNGARTSEPPVAETPIDAGSEISASEARQLDAFAAEFGGAGVQTTIPAVTRSRRSRGRARLNRPRAYRVAIIR